MSTDQVNLVSTILDKVQEYAESCESDITAHDGTTVQILTAPQRVVATDLQAIADKYAATPRHRTGQIEAQDLDTFAALVLRDYDKGSIITADVSGDGVAFTAILDHHVSVAGLDSKGTRSGQRFGKETITYRPALSEEWEVWIEQSNKPMSQGVFAQWVQDHMYDLADPAHLKGAPDSKAAQFGAKLGFTPENLYGYAGPMAMLKVSQGLEVRENSRVSNTVNTDNGTVKIAYESEHVDDKGQPLEVPKRFLLSIPVFERGTVYLVPVKLTYQKKGGNLEWRFELVRADYFKRDAIEGMRADLAIKLTPKDTPAPIVPIYLASKKA